MHKHFIALGVLTALLPATATASAPNLSKQKARSVAARNPPPLGADEFGFKVEPARRCKQQIASVVDCGFRYRYNDGSLKWTCRGVIRVMYKRPDGFWELFVRMPTDSEIMCSGARPA